jgi:hypothetical protein
MHYILRCCDAKMPHFFDQIVLICTICCMTSPNSRYLFL